jgi:hypothetical protein
MGGPSPVCLYCGTARAEHVALGHPYQSEDVRVAGQSRAPGRPGNLGRVVIAATALTLIVGAAKSDAIPKGLLEPLKMAMVPTIARFRAGEADASDLLVSIRSVLGAEWVPSGNWAIELEKMRNAL